MKKSKLAALLKGIGVEPESMDTALLLNKKQLKDLGLNLTGYTNVRLGKAHKNSVDFAADSIWADRLGDHDCVSYDEDRGDDQDWVQITEIVVPTAHDKAELLKGFEYIHDLPFINSNLLAVNTIMHFYQCGDRIRISSRPVDQSRLQLQALLKGLGLLDGSIEKAMCLSEDQLQEFGAELTKYGDIDITDAEDKVKFTGSI